MPPLCVFRKAASAITAVTTLFWLIQSPLAQQMDRPPRKMEWLKMASQDIKEKGFINQEIMKTLPPGIDPTAQQTLQRLSIPRGLRRALSPGELAEQRQRAEEGQIASKTGI